MKHGLGAVREALDQLSLPGDLLSPLLSYAELIRRDADRLGLMSKAGVDRFLDRHLAESLAFALVRRPTTGEVWVDVGSGAGLPGIPLGIAFPHTSILLIEPQHRRAAFLELVTEELGLDRVSVAQARVEDLELSADVAATRAFSSSSGSGASTAVLELLAAAVRPGGTLLVQIALDARDSQDENSVRVRLGSSDPELAFFMMRRQ